ncbi:violaxanthin de-epoxidase, chloroplastic, partial [Tanacetum coccineum]
MVGNVAILPRFLHGGLVHAVSLLDLVLSLLDLVLAYDQFPCQYQLFYRGKAKGSFWYEPVFQVKTLDGKLVWRRRKYRVKRGKVADFSWGLFHYSGAARVAGQSYTGAVLVRPNREYPNETEKQRLVSALDRCCIKEWELFDVDNCQYNDPPLGLPEGSRFTTTLTAIPSDLLGDSPAISRWGYLSLATCHWGTLARDTFPSDKVGPTYFSVK